MKNKSTKEKILYALEDETCALMGCKNILNQNLEEVIKDLTNKRDVIKQAELLLELGFKKEDKFCQECFWK